MREIGEVRSITSSGFLTIGKLKWLSLFSDILVAWFVSTYSAVLVLMARIFRKKSIIFVGGADVNVDPKMGYGLLTSRWKRWFIRYALRRATYVLPMSKHLEERTREIGNYDGSNIRQVAPGLDPQLWQPGQNKEDMILTVAACPTEDRIRIKGIDILIKTACFLPDVPFLIIGIKPGVLTSLHIDLPPNVTIKPFLKENDLLPFYQKSKVYCQPSRIESFSFALAQGMLCECIPVGTNIGGIPEVMGNVGYLVAPGDHEVLASSLQKALDTHSDTGAAARNRVQAKFSLFHRSEKLKQIILG